MPVCIISRICWLVPGYSPDSARTHVETICKYSSCFLCVSSAASSSQCLTRVLILATTGHDISGYFLWYDKTGKNSSHRLHCCVGQTSQLSAVPLFSHDLWILFSTGCFSLRLWKFVVCFAVTVVRCLLYILLYCFHTTNLAPFLTYSSIMLATLLSLSAWAVDKTP